MRKFITHSEWLLFFEAINGSKNEIRDKAMLQMAYVHGLRVSELKWIIHSTSPAKRNCSVIKKMASTT